MNNQEKSKLDIVGTGSVVIEDTPEIEVAPAQLEMFQDRTLTVLIKHDYYSADSSHGRDLLESFLKALEAKKAVIDRIFVVDSGVKLLDRSNDLYNEFFLLYSDVPVLTVCQESLEEYGADTEGLPANAEVLDSRDIASAIIGLQNVIILE